MTETDMTDMTEKTGVVTYVNEEHEIMTDRGFSIQDMYSIKAYNHDHLYKPSEVGTEQNNLETNQVISCTITFYCPCLDLHWNFTWN